jgi:hypothetical protein
VRLEASKKSISTTSDHKHRKLLHGSVDSRRSSDEMADPRPNMLPAKQLTKRHETQGITLSSYQPCPGCVEGDTVCYIREHERKAERTRGGQISTYMLISIFFWKKMVFKHIFRKY